MNRYLANRLRPLTIVLQDDGQGQGASAGDAAEDGASQTEPTEGAPHGAPKPEETDWKAQARKWEERAKANKEAADELEKLKESQMSEQEKAARHTKELEAKLARFQEEKQQQEWRNQVSKESGVPSDLLRGSTLDEVQAHADSIRQYLETSNTANDQGSGTPAGFAPKVGTTPGSKGSIPLSEQIRQAEKDKDVNRSLLLKAMALGDGRTR